MAGQIPDVYARFIADTTAFLEPVLKSVEAVVQLSRSLADVDAALDSFRVAATSTAEASTATAEGAKAAADAQLAMADASKLDAESADALFGVLETLVATERAAADSALFLADAEKAVADASRMAAGATKLAGDEEVVAGTKAKAAAEETGFFSTAMGKAGGAVSAFGGMAKKGLEAFGAATVYSIYEASKFNAEIMRLHTAAGAPLQDLPAISQKMLELGDQFGFSGTKMAEAMYHAESAGLDLKTALNVVADAAQLADIHGASLDKTTYSLSSVMKAFNLQASDAGKTAALLNAIVGEGDMRFEQFNASIKNWAPTAASMGISIQSMGAAIAYLTDRGNSAEVAATRLTMGLSMMTSGSKQANAYLHELGLTADFVSAKNQTLADMMTKAGLTTNRLAADLKKPDGVFVALKDLQDAFHKAGLSAEESNQLMAKVFGGGRSDKAIMSLMQNLDGIKQKFDATGGAVKEFGDSAQKALQTPEQRFKTLEATVQNLAIQFGSAMLPAVQSLADGLSKMFADPTFVAGMEQFGKYLGEVLKQAEPLVPVIMKIGIELMKAFGPVLPILAPALVKLAQAMGGQLDRVLVQMAPHLPALARSFGDLLVALIPVIRATADMLVALTPLIPAITKLTEIAALGGGTMISIYARAISYVSDVVKLLAQIIGWGVKIIYSAWKWLFDELIGHSIIPDLVNGMTSWFTHGMADLVQIVARGVSEVVNWMASLPGKIVGALGNLGSLLWNAGVSLIQGLINGIQANLGNLYSMVGGIAGMIQNLKGPIEKDRTLLVPHGRALMDGLQAGIEQGLGGVYDTVASIAPTIAGHHGHGHGGHGHSHRHHIPGPSGLGSLAAGIGYQSGVGALAYGAGGQIVNNYTIVQVAGSVLSERDLTRLVQKGLSKHSSVNSTSGTTVPAGRTG